MDDTTSGSGYPAPTPSPVPRHGNPTARRWAIWLDQMAQGREPCFGTDHRYTCGEASCRWREACLRMRADWLR